MKFISNFCLGLIFFMMIWSGTLVFVNNASIYSWIVAILLAIATALIINRNKGKHDE